MAHYEAGAPLLVRTSNCALCPGAPLVCLEKKIVTSGAPCVWCAISVFHTNGAPAHGAPLLYSSGAPHVWGAISGHFIYSPFPSSVPSDHFVQFHQNRDEQPCGKEIEEA